MTKHTPGPWTIRGDVHPVSPGADEPATDLYCADIIPPESSDGWRGHICYIQSADHLRNGIGIEEAQANARLIAAAPELLAACEIACKTWVHIPRGESVHLDAMRDAVAKARGEG